MIIENLRRYLPTVVIFAVVRVIPPAVPLWLFVLGGIGAAYICDSILAIIDAFIYEDE